MTEVRGASKLLYLDEVTTDRDTGAAIGLWLERIAHDLEEMLTRAPPCRRHLA